MEQKNKAKGLPEHKPLVQMMLTVDFETRQVVLLAIREGDPKIEISPDSPDLTVEGFQLWTRYALKSL